MTDLSRRGFLGGLLAVPVAAAVPDMLFAETLGPELASSFSDVGAWSVETPFVAMPGPTRIIGVSLVQRLRDNQAAVNAAWRAMIRDHDEALLAPVSSCLENRSVA